MTTIPPLTAKPVRSIRTRDNTADIQRVFDEVNGSGATIAFPPGTYNLTKGLIAPARARVTAYGAVINLQLSNDAPAHTARPQCIIEGGDWFTRWSGLIYSGLYGAAWSFGSYYGAGFDTNNVTLRNLRVNTNAIMPATAPYFGRGGNGILVFSGCSAMRFENIGTLDYVQHMSNVIAGHWGCADKTASSTRHPSMHINGLTVGVMDNRHIETSPVSTSAMDWAVIENVDCKHCASGFVGYPGDFGYGRAETPALGMVTLRNYRVRSAWYAAMLGAKTKDGAADTTRYQLNSVYLGCTKTPTFPEGAYVNCNHVFTRPV